MTDTMPAVSREDAKGVERQGSLLEVADLRKTYEGRGSRRRRLAISAVDGISFDVAAGETLGLVGESGCGKSTTANLVTRLTTPSAGSIRFNGRDITRLSERKLRPIRRDLQIVFQDPQSSLNPRQTVGAILSAPFEIQGVTPPSGLRAEVRSLMERVGLNPEHYNRYPHEFSGGQRQRVGIARAIALRPKLIVCDEPVSALDVSVQAQVMNLLADLQREFKMAYLFVGHDLAVVRHISDRVAVMYLGRIVELADRESLYRDPKHPYTKALLSAVPIPNPRARDSRERVLLRGDVERATQGGCVFRPRCPRYQSGLTDGERQRCENEEPTLLQLGETRSAACHFA